MSGRAGNVGSHETLTVERAEPKVTLEERARIEREHRALRQEDVLGGRLTFESGPYEAHVGFSNYCNMSCIMCWDGANPPLVKMPGEVVRKLAEQIAPSMSVITPHSASEPLILTWDETRRVAEEYSIRLSLTTNVQFLDEQKFYELKDITETLHLSIDSHIREIFERIRPGSKPDQVFENLERTARLCREHRVDCIGQAVFMTENAAMMPETTAYLADIGIPTVNIIPLIDVNGRSGMSDPLLHLSSEYVDHIKGRCVEVAREKRICLRWLDREWHDFRDPSEKIEPHPGNAEHAQWEHQMRYYAPGYCRSVFGRLRINADGEVAPCCYATDGDLVLGRLAEEDFGDMWNGPNARDLRRAMLTWDYPMLCGTCRWIDKVGTQRHLPFVDELCHVVNADLHEIAPDLMVLAPEHMTRGSAPPTIVVEPPAAGIASWHLGVSLGGGIELAGAPHHLEISGLTPRATAPGRLAFAFPDSVWRRLRANLGYWWAVVGVLADDPRRAIRSPELRCLVRHQDLPRIEASTLRYSNGAELPVADLGREKKHGWEDRSALPERPALGARSRNLHAWHDVLRGQKAARRVESEIHRVLRGTDAGGRREAHIPRLPFSSSEYADLVERVHAVAQSALPAGKTALVVSRGDDSLIDLGATVGWHFPRDDGGRHAGFHPPDSAWAAAHLEAMRTIGADYLLVPATELWWLESYADFASHLVSRYAVLVEDAGTCVVFDLR